MVDAVLSLSDVEGTYGGKPPASLNGFDLIWENGAAVHVRSGYPCIYRIHTAMRVHSPFTVGCK